MKQLKGNSTLSDMVSALIDLRPGTRKLVRQVPSSMPALIIIACLSRQYVINRRRGRHC